MLVTKIGAEALDTVGGVIVKGVGTKSNMMIGDGGLLFQEE